MSTLQILPAQPTDNTKPSSPFTLLRDGGHPSRGLAASRAGTARSNCFENWEFVPIQQSGTGRNSKASISEAEDLKNLREQTVEVFLSGISKVMLLDIRDILDILDNGKVRSYLKSH